MPRFSPSSGTSCNDRRGLIHIPSHHAAGASASATITPPLRRPSTRRSKSSGLRNGSTRRRRSIENCGLISQRLLARPSGTPPAGRGGRSTTPARHRRSPIADCARAVSRSRRSPVHIRRAESAHPRRAVAPCRDSADPAAYRYQDSSSALAGSPENIWIWAIMRRPSAELGESADARAPPPPAPGQAACSTCKPRPARNGRRAPPRPSRPPAARVPARSAAIARDRSTTHWRSRSHGSRR